MQFFHPDSKFMAAFTLLADIVILNMLLVVTSLPVVTGGAAWRAANVVVGDMVQGRGSRYALQFIRQLTVRWKTVSLYWVLLLLAGGLLVYQQFVVFQAGISGFALTAIQALALAGAFIIAGISVWFFALASLPSRGDGTRARATISAKPAFRPLAAASIQLMFRFLGRTAVAVAILVGAVWAVFALPVALSVPLVFFFVPAVALYLVRLVLAGALGQELGD
ncbi:MusI family membrane protein [Corynebacterium urinipleomorphum]|uniref:DUF624 domain-containing protein n=1 Tax=Corynebacterium urinipleomorphum TaxID=1852380 RepID=UPI000B35891A|nr:DUF624 domain-containing protein [Corynebacterium urinipleomorphum]